MDKFGAYLIGVGLGFLLGVLITITIQMDSGIVEESIEDVCSKSKLSEFRYDCSSYEYDEGRGMYIVTCFYEGGLKVGGGVCDISWILNKNTTFQYVNICFSYTSYQDAVMSCEERIPDEIKEIITVVS